MKKVRRQSCRKQAVKTHRPLPSTAAHTASSHSGFLPPDRRSFSVGARVAGFPFFLRDLAAPNRLFKGFGSFALPCFAAVEARGCLLRTLPSACDFLMGSAVLAPLALHISSNCFCKKLFCCICSFWSSRTESTSFLSALWPVSSLWVALGAGAGSQVGSSLLPARQAIMPCAVALTLFLSVW
eukprot:Skav214809  [mRNA]  locus=scaffold1934:377:925:- [translate_table: standard]